MRARVTLDDVGNTARVEAAEGRFDTEAEQLVLRRDVRVVSSDGYTIDLRSAEIDFQSGEVTSTESVQVHFRDGTIAARGLRVREGGAVITFEGPVESIIAAPPPPPPPIWAARRHKLPTRPPIPPIVRALEIMPRISFSLARIRLARFAMAVAFAAAALSFAGTAEAQNPDRAIRRAGQRFDRARSASMRTGSTCSDRENRAVYAGNVVAVQGDTTIRCSQLTIVFERDQEGEDEGDAIRRIECEGPVTILLSRTRVATGDRATYDRQSGQMVISGDVALSQGQNVTRGDRLVYDIDRGVANVEAGERQRVRGLFRPRRDRPAMRSGEGGDSCVVRRAGLV